MTIESVTKDQFTIIVLNRSMSREEYRDNCFRSSRIMIKCYVGDFNTHNVMWNCRRTDVSGNRLMDEMERVELYVMNDDTKTHVGVWGATIQI